MNQDYDWQKRLDNYCTHQGCKPADAWAWAYDGAHFSIHDFLASEEERLGVSFDSSTVSASPEAAL